MRQLGRYIVHACFFTVLVLWGVSYYGLCYGWGDPILPNSNCRRYGLHATYGYLAFDRTRFQFDRTISRFLNKYTYSPWLDDGWTLGGVTSNPFKYMDHFLPCSHVSDGPWLIDKEQIVNQHFGFYVQFYWLAFPLGFLSIPRLYRDLQRRNRQKHNLCLTCGYDLRATPHRCPECGQLVDEKRLQPDKQGGTISH